MSVASQDTFLNLTTPLSVVGSGGIVPGSGVDAIVSGANISTIGASVGDVTVALQADLTNINSVGFATGGAVTGLSTINGAPVGSVSVPPVFAASTINLDVAAGTARLTSGYGTGRFIALETTNVTGNKNAYIEIDSELGNIELTTSDDLYALRSATLGLSPEGVGLSSGDYQMILESSNSTIKLIGATGIVLEGGLVQIPNTASISTLTAGTLALGTIGPIIDAVSATPTQTFNILIGNMRMQGGTVPPSATGTTITWASRFGSVPTVYTGMAGAIGSSTVLIAVTAAGETSGTFSAPAGTPVGNTINWLAIGAA